MDKVSSTIYGQLVLPFINWSPCLAAPQGLQPTITYNLWWGNSLFSITKFPIFWSISLSIQTHPIVSHPTIYQIFSHLFILLSLLEGKQECCSTLTSTRKHLISSILDLIVRPCQPNEILLGTTIFSENTYWFTTYFHDLLIAKT